MQTINEATKNQEVLPLHTLDEVIFPVIIGLLVTLFLKAIWPAFATFLYRAYLKTFIPEKAVQAVGNPGEVYSIPPKETPITYGLPVAEVYILNSFVILLSLLFVASIGSSQGLYEIGLFFTSPMVILGCFIFKLVTSQKDQLSKELFLTYGTLFSLKYGFITTSNILS